MKRSHGFHALAVLVWGAFLLPGCKDDTPSNQRQMPANNPQTGADNTGNINNGNQNPQAVNNKPQVGPVTENNQPVFAKPGGTGIARFNAKDPDAGDSIARITFKTMPEGVLPAQPVTVNAQGMLQTYQFQVPSQVSAQQAVGVFEVCDTHNACETTQFPLIFGDANQAQSSGPSTMQTFCTAMVPVVGTLTQGGTQQSNGTQTGTQQPNLSQALMTLGCQLIH